MLPVISTQAFGNLLAFFGETWPVIAISVPLASAQVHRTLPRARASLRSLALLYGITSSAHFAGLLDLTSLAFFRAVSGLVTARCDDRERLAASLATDFNLTDLGQSGTGVTAEFAAASHLPRLDVEGFLAVLADKFHSANDTKNVDTTGYLQ